MRRIAYIELDTHAEIASRFYRLLRDSPVFTVEYYFSPKIAEQVQLTGNNVFVLQPAELLNKLRQQKYELVLIGTVHRYFQIFYKVVQEFRTAVIVHNLNFSQETATTLYKNIGKEETKYRVKLALKEHLHLAPLVYKKAAARLVLDASMASDGTQWLPLFYAETPGSSGNQILNIVIPGSVQQQRRDYQHVLRQLAKSKELLHVTFLGKAAGAELQWLQRFEQEYSVQVSLRYYTEKVPQLEFDNVMRNADVLWCPIQRRTRFFSVAEEYGRTKMSGNIGDAISYAKPAVFPRWFTSPYEFIHQEQVHIDAQLLALKNMQYDFLQNYSKETVRTRLEEVLQRLLKPE